MGLLEATPCRYCGMIVLFWGHMSCIMVPMHAHVSLHLSAWRHCFIMETYFCLCQSYLGDDISRVFLKIMSHGLQWIQSQLPQPTMWQFCIGTFFVVVILSVNRVQLFATPWTVTHQAPLSMNFSQTRILEWVAVSFSRGSSQPRDLTCVSCVGRQILYHWATRGL